MGFLRLATSKSTLPSDSSSVSHEMHVAESSCASSPTLLAKRGRWSGFDIPGPRGQLCFSRVESSPHGGQDVRTRRGRPLDSQRNRRTCETDLDCHYNEQVPNARTCYH